MKKIIRLTEQELIKIVKRVVNESQQYTELINLNDENIPIFMITCKDTQTGKIVNVTGDVEIEDDNTVVAYLKPGRYKPLEKIDIDIRIPRDFIFTNYRVTQHGSMTKPIMGNNKIELSVKMNNNLNVGFSVYPNNFILKELKLYVRGLEENGVVAEYER